MAIHIGREWKRVEESGGEWRRFGKKRRVKTKVFEDTWEQWLAGCAEGFLTLSHLGKEEMSCKYISNQKFHEELTDGSLFKNILRNRSRGHFC